MAPVFLGDLDENNQEVFIPDNPLGVGRVLIQHVGLKPDLKPLYFAMPQRLMNYLDLYKTKGLLATLIVTLLSACAMHSGVQSSCKVFDPDLIRGLYTGGCKDGLAEGYGEVRGESGYRGDFLAGMKHGKGIKMMPNGDRYAGNFIEDYRHGRGVYIWSANGPWAGDRYEGEYLRDKRHGWGIYQWGSGDRYEGPWQDDLRMGLSVMELRRTQAGDAAARSSKVGALVCVEAQLGLVSRQRISGKIEQVDGVAMQIRIVAVEGGVASYLGRAVRAGDVLFDKATHWQLCGQN